MDMHSQKYNPEVPTQQNVNNDQLHQLNDQLITLKNMVNKQVSESVEISRAGWQMGPINFNLHQYFFLTKKNFKTDNFHI
jgi:hypothetical protein